MWGPEQAPLPLEGVAVSPALVELITMLDEDLDDEEEDEGIVTFTDPFEGESEADSEWEDEEDDGEGEDIQGGHDHDAPV